MKTQVEVCVCKTSFVTVDVEEARQYLIGKGTPAEDLEDVSPEAIAENYVVNAEGVDLDLCFDRDVYSVATWSNETQCRIEGGRCRCGLGQCAKRHIL